MEVSESSGNSRLVKHEWAFFTFIVFATAAGGGDDVLTTNFRPLFNTLLAGSRYTRHTWTVPELWAVNCVSF